MATLDSTTAAEYAAEVNADDRAQVIIDALANPVYAKVYNSDEIVLGSGTLASPWATVSNGNVIPGTLNDFFVTSPGVPNDGWHLQFESGSRYVRMTFGLPGSGREAIWSLPSWDVGTRSGISQSTIVVTGNRAPAWSGAPTTLLFAQGTGGTQAFAPFASDPDSDDLTYSLVDGSYTGISINALTGVLTVTGAATAGTRTLTIRATDSNGLYADTVCLTTIASGSSIRFNPGFYVYFSPSKYPGTNYTNISPSTAGDYSVGFNWVDQVLARAAQNNQKVMLGVQPVHFGNYPSDWTFAFPAYLVAPANGGTDSAGTYGIVPFNVNPTGLQTKIWTQATMDRLIALSQAYGARYNSNAALEMVAFGETSLNILSGTYGYSFAAIDAQLKRQLIADRAAWPNTAVRLNANYYWSSTNNTEIISLVNAACAAKVCIGGPDVLPNETIRANQAFTGAYAGSTDWRGVIPFVAEVQSPELGGKEGTYTNEQIYLAAMQGISTASGGATGSGSAVFRATQPQYFVWYYNTWSGGDEQKWATGTLPFIRSINGAVHSTAYPSGY